MTEKANMTRRYRKNVIEDNDIDGIEDFYDPR